MNYDLDNNNILYSWKYMDILTIFNNTVYLVCSKRGTNSDKCRGKAKYYKYTGEMIIYNKCTNDPIIQCIMMIIIIISI